MYNKMNSFIPKYYCWDLPVGLILSSLIFSYFTISFRFSVLFLLDDFGKTISALDVALKNKVSETIVGPEART